MSKPSEPKSLPNHGPRVGLVIRAGAAKFARPAAGVTSRPPVASTAATLPPLHITSHRALAEQQAAIAERVAAHPDMAVMLLINPVLAFKQLGITLSAEVADHVLHAIQHPPALRNRRDQLEARLKAVLGEPARPTDGHWNAHLLFELRHLKPLAIGDLRPVYGAPLGQAESQKLQALRPAGGVRYPQPRRLPPRSRVGSVAWKESLRRIDLDAPAPTLPMAEVRPEAVPLEDLWFYKDLDDAVRDALELGVILRRAFPIHTPDSFRQVLEGRKPNAFRSWVTGLRFNPR